MLPEEVSEHGRSLRRIRMFLPPMRHGLVKIFHRLAPGQASAKPHSLKGRLSDIKPDTISNHRQLPLDRRGAGGTCEKGETRKIIKIAWNNDLRVSCLSRLSRFSRASRTY
jgi:hypothetical protein